MTTDLILVIDRRDTRVELNGKALCVRHGDAPPEHVPLGVLGQVIVHGKALIACDVWRALAERGIPGVLLPARGRSPAALVGAALGATIELRTAQHRAADRPELALSIARRLLAAKLDAQRRAALHLAAASTGAAAAPNALAALTAALDEAGDKLQRARTVGTLMGFEGGAAGAWYRWLAGWLPDAWQFAGRNRRPPRDPVNVLLSLGYTLLGGEMLAAVQRQGLDPARGFLHGIVPGRESLVLDLIEPLRPSVDCVVLGLLDSVLVPADFTTGTTGCQLGKDGRERFYRAWAQARRDWPDLAALPAVPAASAPADRDTATADPHPAAATAQTDAVDATDTSLPQLCGRRVDTLRRWLKPALPQAE
ncbi:CRISPR-associated endonuclease Cas1 [Thiohalocapsa sp. ML1]|jgi:CRISP-associated protein Cas1|uniref:CRISPR-associated endonuclease Cas1 n=1 Tax=Thiohalocapsa sp. ML1 TaxID=1431688 RepID=UPI000731F4C8|nr:CRISPR-associated endonuclease Cas1 [Thiohalocapsa sp. ML1]